MQILDGNENKQNNNKNNNKMSGKKVALITLVSALVLGGATGGYFIYQNMENGKQVTSEYKEAKKTYEKVGKKISKEDFKKMKEQEKKPLAKLDPSKDDNKTEASKPKEEGKKGSATAKKNPSGGVTVEGGEGVDGSGQSIGIQSSINTQSRDDSNQTEMDKESAGTLEDFLENTEAGGGGEQIKFSEADVAGAILQQYSDWNKRIKNDLGWGKDKYPEEGYDATRETIRQIGDYIRTGKKPELFNAPFTIEQGAQNYKQSAFDGLAFDFMGEQSGFDQRMAGYFKYNPKFSEIYSIYLTPNEQEFDGALSHFSAVINTDKGTWIAYILIEQDKVQLLDITK